MKPKQNTNNIIQRRQTQQLQANEGKSIVKLNEADLRYVVSESVRRIYEHSDKEYPKIGDYTVVPDTDSMEHYSDSLKHFGWYHHVLMYFSNAHTYCLMQRVDNRKYFFVEIVDAPELGENKTKFTPVSMRDIPTQIYQDSVLRLHR